MPIASALRVHLLAHKLRSGRSEGLVFGRSADAPRRRAAKVWRRVGLEPIGLHESRHTFASLMIAAGVNAKALSSYTRRRDSRRSTRDRAGAV